jgi:formimidoylglutamate deiminase
LIFAKRALLPEGWADDVRITFAGGRMDQVTPAAQAQPGDTRVQALLPALSNLHSHSFQRAMAGMTEHRIAGRDSFWTWRDLMYRFLDRLTPAQMEAIAALVFMYMQEAGFAL